MLIDPKKFDSELDLKIEKGTAHSAASAWSGPQVSCATKRVKIGDPIPDIAACCIALSFSIVAGFWYLIV